jgi:hypothetical protein
MAETVPLITIKRDSEALFSLGIATKADYLLKDSFGSDLAFTLNRALQKYLLTRPRKYWIESLTWQAERMDDYACQKLHAWLETRKQTFRSALMSKTVLHFDVLVLGIVSTVLTVYGLRKKEILRFPFLVDTARNQAFQPRQKLGNLISALLSYTKVSQSRTKVVHCTGHCETRETGCVTNVS